jgi:hypothetical protein
MSSRPLPEEFAAFYAGYVARVPEDDILSVLAAQAEEVRRLAAAAPPGRETFRYGPGKWSVRQVLGHLVDGERAFGYRAFCISRGEQANLPSFDENEYVARSPYDRIPAAALAEEFTVVRDANLRVLRALPEDAWVRVGAANGYRVSVRALAWIMAGHVRHHQGVLRERYGLEA